MDLLLVQSAGQLGDALLIELVQAIVQPDRAIAELACAIIQGVTPSYRVLVPSAS